MALNNRKILDTDVTTKGVVAAPNILKGSAQQNKAIFDRLIREIVKERLNALIDDLTAVTAAGELGASVEGVTGNTVQAVLSALKAEVDTKAGEAGVTAKLALKADKADTDLHFKAIGFDATTGTFTFTRENGTSVEVDTALEKVAVNFTYDATTEELVLTLADGSTQRISLAALISIFDFVDSSTVVFGVSGGTVTAQIKAGSITDEMLSTALVEYLEGLVSDAESSEIAAGGSAQSAAGAAEDSEAAASRAESAAASANTSAGEAGAASRSAAASAASASGAVTKYPYIDGESGNWMVWDTSQGTFVNTGVHAAGADGEDGKDGADGQPGADGADGATFTPIVSDSGVIFWRNDKGLPNPPLRNITGPQGVPGADGYSPTVSTQTITGGTEITITDKNGDHVFDVMNGADGQDGAPGQPGADGAPGQPGADGTKWFSGGTQAALYAAETTANVGDYFWATADFFPEVWDTTSGPAIMWVSKGDVLFLASKEHEHHWDATGNNIIGPKGDIGPAGPNLINGSTSTTLTGVLRGNGSNVAVQAVDTTPTSGSGNLITSGGVQAALDGKAPIINGIYYGVCSTAAATATKVVTISGVTELTAGVTIAVKFDNAQVWVGIPSLNVNSLGAKSIRRTGDLYASTYEWQAGEVLTMTYDGKYWVIHDGGLADEFYYGATKLETSAISTSTATALTPASLNSLAKTMIASYAVYSASKTYAVGDRVRYNYGIYECITAITTAEAWTAAHWRLMEPLQDQIDGKVDTSDYAPVTKTSDMTQQVGKDANGQLWTASELPAVSAADNGKVLTVVSGAWAAAELPLYDGSVI